jgi:hypothetical protein
VGGAFLTIGAAEFSLDTEKWWLPASEFSGEVESLCRQENAPDSMLEHILVAKV